MAGTGPVPGGLMNLMHRCGASNSEIDRAYRYAHGQPSVYDAPDTPSYIPEPFPPRAQLRTMEPWSPQSPGCLLDSASNSMLIRSSSSNSNRPQPDPQSNWQPGRPTTRPNQVQSRQTDSVEIPETIYCHSQPIETSSSPVRVIDLTIVETSEESDGSQSEPDLEIEHFQTTTGEIAEKEHVELEDEEQAQLGIHDHLHGRSEANFFEMRGDVLEDLGQALQLMSESDIRGRDDDELSEMNVDSLENFGPEVAQQTNYIHRGPLEYGETHWLQYEGTESELSEVNEDVLAVGRDGNEDAFRFLEDLGNRDINLGRRRFKDFHEEDHQYNSVTDELAGPSGLRTSLPLQDSASFIKSLEETSDEQLRRQGIFEELGATKNQKQATNIPPRGSQKRKGGEFEPTAKRARTAGLVTTIKAARSQQTAALAGNHDGTASQAAADHEENEGIVDLDSDTTQVDLFVHLDTEIDQKSSSKVVFVATPKPSTWTCQHDEIVVLGHPYYRAEDAESFHNYPDPGEAAFLVLGSYDLDEFRNAEEARKTEKTRKKAEKEKEKGKENPTPQLGHEDRGLSKAQWPLGRITIYEENDWEIPDYASLGEFDNFQSVATPGCVDEQLLKGIPVSMEEFGNFLPNHYAKFGLSNRLEHNGWEPTRWSDYISKQRGLNYKYIVKKNTLQNQLKLSRDAYNESKEELKTPALVRTVDEWDKGDSVRNPKRDMDYYICDLAAGVPRKNFPTGPNALLLTRAIECCLDNKLYFVKLSEIHQLARKYKLGSKVPPPPGQGENRDRESFNAYEKDLINWRREKKAEALSNGVNFY